MSADNDGLELAIPHPPPYRHRGDPQKLGSSSLANEVVDLSRFLCCHPAPLHAINPGFAAPVMKLKGKIRKKTDASIRKKTDASALILCYTLFMLEKPKCPECGSAQVYYRRILKESVCRRYGYLMMENP